MIIDEWGTELGVRFSDATVRALLFNASKAVDVRPSWTTPGAFDVSARGLIGAIALPDQEIMIRPKVPLDTAVHMMCVADDLPPVSDELAHFPSDSLTSFVAQWYLHLTAPLVERALLRRYRLVEEPSEFIKGSIDVPSSMRLSMLGSAAVVCRFDEFTPDVTENQVLLAATRVLLSSPGLAPRLSQRLHRLASMLDEVTRRTPPLWERRRVVFNRLNRRYRSPLHVAEWILDRASPELYRPEPTRPFHAFLIDMAVVFERYVRAELRRRLRPLGLLCDAGETLWIDQQRSLFKTKPDIVVKSPLRKLVVILDTKYKRLGEAYRPAEDDIYQVVTYCTTRGSPTGILVYPQLGDTPTSTARITGVDVRLTLFPINVGRGRVVLRGELDRLANYVRDQLDLADETDHASGSRGMSAGSVSVAPAAR